MTTADKNGKPIVPRAEVRMVGTVERVTPEGVFVKIRDGLVVYVSAEALEVVK